MEFSLKQMGKIAKKKYIMVESYRDMKELSNLQCWGLTCKSYYHDRDWIYLFKKNAGIKKKKTIGKRLEKFITKNL